jgi:hypothetical protein
MSNAWLKQDDCASYIERDICVGHSLTTPYLLSICVRYLTDHEADWRQERRESSNKHIARKGDVSSRLFQPYGSLTVALSEPISHHLRYDAATRRFNNARSSARGMFFVSV